MTPADAAKLLDLPADASPEQLEARFLELRRKLEDKIAKAPTPGLQAKYRESLAEITTAFETLTLAADSSSLPVTSKQSAVSSQRSVNTASTPGSSLPAPSASRPRSGGKEFLLVAIIAAVVLAAGGWFVMKTRAENAEKARIVAEQKAEAERDRLAKEAAVQAEKERQEKLYTSLRSRVAELNVAYDALMRSETTAERELSELKSQERDLARDLKGAATPVARRLAAQLRAHDRYVTWLRETLPVHPAKVAKARLEELISARAVDDATQAAEAYVAALDLLKSDLAAAKAGIVLTGTITLEANVTGATWRFTDAFGVERRGLTPATVTDAALGPAEVAFTFSTFPEMRQPVTIEARQPARSSVAFENATLVVRVMPDTAVIHLGPLTRPARQPWELGPGTHSLRIEAEGYAPRDLVVTVRAGEKLERAVQLGSRPVDFMLAEAMAIFTSSRDEALLPLAAGNYGASNRAYLVVEAFAAAGDQDGFSRAATVFLERLPRIGITPKNTGYGLSPVGSRQIRDSHLVPIRQYPDWAQQLIRQSTPSLKEYFTTMTPLKEAVELMVAGKDPLASGLTDQDLERESYNIVNLLLHRHQRPDLASTWYARWRTRVKAPDKHLQDKLTLLQLMNHFVIRGETSRAVQEFERIRASLLAEDPRLTYFTDAHGGFATMIVIAGMVGDQAGVNQLADLAASLRQTTPAGYTKDNSGGNDWPYLWFEAERLAGRGQAIEPLVAGLLASGPAKPVASGQLGGLLGGLAQSGVATPSGASLSYMAQNKLCLFLAKRQVERGETEAAFRTVLAQSKDGSNACRELALTFASLGNYAGAMDALERSRRAPYDSHVGKYDAAAQKNMDEAYLSTQGNLARAFGTGVAERLDVKQAQAAIRSIRDPAHRMIALAAYVIRDSELQTLTPAQRNYIRILPPL